MPVYQCYYPQGLLAKSAKAEIADQITSIHCNATGAPPSFVNVLFLELPEGECFVAGKPATHSYVFGIVRHGRDLETRQGMLRDLSRMWIDVTGQSDAELIVALTETDPANVMEAGLIFPEPGQEEQWFEQNRAKLTQLGWTTVSSDSR
ncbi:MAG: cis-3-chloroacrylic acid dehalogenase [Mycobacterium sp.]|jgi:phenylpyruvate tautomerase PptA (4-oxalocrotonate tautomerase family)|uniref:tautomerase family protein n=1 Tax=Mycobacterium sp. TaxID=1785 RepID=UPI002633BFA3|nr:tautomerase family protein [Mycobacterium sp.]MCW2664430.1 cis-3-chloroacrylic acid dehalogenase [Mycobacterium sp.]